MATGSESTARADASRRSWISRHFGAVVGSVLLAALCVWLLRAGALPIVPDKASLAKVRWSGVVAYAAVWLVVLLLRSIRWRWLLEPIEPVAWRPLLTVSLVSLGAMVVLPFRLGEAARPALIRRSSGVSGWAALGTVAAERIVDGLFLSLMLLAALRIATPRADVATHVGELPIPTGVVIGASYVAAAVFLVASIVGLAVYRFRGMVHAVASRLARPLGAVLAERVTQTLDRVADGLTFLGNRRCTGLFLGATAAYWLLNAAGFFLLMWAVGLSAPTFAQAAVVMGTLGLGVVAPNTPGYFGVYQISAYAGLALYFSSGELVTAGASFVFFLYVTQIGLILLVALGALLVGHASPRAILADDAG